MTEVYYDEVIDDGVYPADTMWAALVVKDNLKMPDDKVNYVATTKASTQQIAISNIVKKQWKDFYWIEDKSKTLVLAIYRVGHPRIFAENTDKPVRRRRRTR